MGTNTALPDPSNLTDDQLATMPWSQLLQMRKSATDQAQQNRLANFEHRAYARETVAADPKQALFLGAAIPAYQAVKALPKAITGNQSRSDPSLAQAAAGFHGILEGLINGED